MNPVCYTKLQQNNPEVILAELIQAAISAGVLVADKGRMWQGTALELNGLLTQSECPNWRKAVDLLSNPRSTGIYLGRISDDPEHFATKYQLVIRKGRQKRGFTTYLIHRIPDEEPQSQLL